VGPHGSESVALSSSASGTGTASGATGAGDGGGVAGEPKVSSSHESDAVEYGSFT